MRPAAVGLLVVMMVVATSAFGIGAALEKATASASTPAVNQETPGTAESGPETAPAKGEVVLGFNLESIPLIAAALVGSMALAGVVLLYWRRGAVLWAAGAAMAVFALLDVVEVIHQVSEQHPTLVVVAGTVGLLHAATAVMAIRVATTVPQSGHGSVASPAP